MKRTVMVAISAAAMVLAGTAVATAQTAASNSAISQDLYLQLVRGTYPELENATDAALITAGQGTCAMFESGRSTSSIYDTMIVAGLGPDDGNALVRYSVKAFCNEFTGQLR